MNLGLGPNERLGVDVIGGDEGVDVGHQFPPTAEGCARKRLGAVSEEFALERVSATS